MLCAILVALAAFLFFLVGRATVQRTPRYRIGRQVVYDITDILARRDFVGDELIVKSVRRWEAFGFKWILSVEQEK